MDRSGAQRTLARGDELRRIERDGAVVRTACGRPGRPACTTVRVCGSPAAAERAYARAVQACLDSGWRHAVAPPGWPGACRPPEARHDRFEARLQRELHAPGLAAAYVTWLAGQGDPRGTLGALQHRAAPYDDATLRAARRFAWLFDPDGAALPPAWSRRDPLSPRLALDLRSGRAAAEGSLRARHRRRLLGDLHDHADPLELTWHRGFLDTATLHLAGADDDDDEPIDDGERLRRLLRLRSARLLRALHLEFPDWDDASEDDGDVTAPIDLLAGVLAGPPAPALRSFALGREPEYEEEEDDDFHDFHTARDVAPVLGALADLAAVFPRLEHLALAGRDLDVGAWAFPALRHAELHFARPEQPAVAAFARADWPRLASLRLGLGNFEAAADAADALAVLAPILTARRLPALRHLALVHTPDPDAVCGVLARSPLAARLETLELADGDLSGAGARDLAAARHRFPRLRRLDLPGNQLGARDERRLRRAFAGVKLHFGPQRVAMQRARDDEDDLEALQLAALGGVPAVPSGLLRSDDDLPDHLDDRFELLLDGVATDADDDDEPRPQ